MIHNAFSLDVPMSSNEPQDGHGEEIMSFRSKQMRAQAFQVEKPVQTDACANANESNACAVQNTIARDNQRSSQSQRVPSSNESCSQLKNFKDDEDDDEDVHNREPHSQHSKVPNWNEKIEFDENEKVLIRPKNGDLCPIGEDNWHKVDKVYKVDIVALVRKHYNQGKEARASQERYHTTGNKSFAMKRDEFVGNCRKLIAERTTDHSLAKDVEDEVFNELMYRSPYDEVKKHQRVIGFGMGVNYNDIFGVDGEIKKRVLHHTTILLRRY
ncbi:hypothetical protein Cgig2_009228 [Carnegiea gigantea]|uniref:Uncharacterized protein n=1 Tax=Carnegiea gigantea TaxID=171969 RepID=A0A9Q1K906_9CARY|nr:hypothetical protein Cgig2_009228 [Carnegiea gigantea]